MKKSSLFFVCLSFLSCFSPSEPLKQWEAYDETPELAANATHPITRMRYKRIQSKHRDRNSLFSPFEKALSRYTQADHEAVKGLILEQDILTIQKHIAEKKLTYEALVLFYLYRIYHFETNHSTYLNALINLNPDVLKEARKKDAQRSKSNTHPLYGMPILLKDNIDALPMATTAGAAALENNFPSEDAFLVKQLKSKGALILGKVNMSEWAYYFCQACPLGYSAMGGQTLNPYGRKTFETGGSSSGSGVAVAANYAVAAIGSETSGSILSPSGKNSVVGLKPTIGAISRSGVIPISSSMDTAGPMTKNILDNAIKYSEGAPQIALKTAVVEGQYTIKISDKGMGMDQETLKLIFQKFYRVQSGNIHNIKGHGLGLSYVKKILELLNGTIHVRSTLGEGSEFTIQLPLES